MQFVINGKKVRINMKNLNRNEIQEYFYGNKLPYIIMSVLFAVGFLYLIAWKLPTAIGVSITGYIVMKAWRHLQLTKVNATTEQHFDEFLTEDIAHFKERGLEKLGLVKENVQIADPIVVTGPYLDYVPPKYMENKRSLFATQLVLKEGVDNRIRSSLVQITTFHFSEDQIFVYQVNYDICTGEVYEESTYEYFYADVDCVKTGERLEKTKNRNKVISRTYEYFSVIVTSGTSTYAISQADESILEHQVMSMRGLIRDKKNNLKTI